MEIFWGRNASRRKVLGDGFCEKEMECDVIVRRHWNQIKKIVVKVIKMRTLSSFGGVKIPTLYKYFVNMPEYIHAKEVTTYYLLTGCEGRTVKY